jgi:hypothetical protein
MPNGSAAGLGSVHTLMTQVHLELQGLELFREPRAGLCAHLLVRPLLQAVKFLVDVHCGGSEGVEARVRGQSARWGCGVM